MPKTGRCPQLDWGWEEASSRTEDGNSRASGCSYQGGSWQGQEPREQLQVVWGADEKPPAPKVRNKEGISYWQQQKSVCLVAG